jgi:hypothetical protein
LWKNLTTQSPESKLAKERADIENPISAFYGGPDTAGAKERGKILSEQVKYPFQSVGERKVSEGIIEDTERNLESEKVRLASDPREDIIVDETVGREELIDPEFGTSIEIGTLTDEEIVKAKLGKGTEKRVSTKDPVDNIEAGKNYTYVDGKLVEIEKDASIIVDQSKGMRGSETEIKTPMNPKKNLDIDALSLITDSLEGVETSRKETKKLIEEWRSKVKADQQTIEGSRNKRNELNFWRSLVKMGEAVGKADPTKGFLNALAEGATAGSTEYLDKRLELLKEAEGDGQKAINALKTNIALQQADTKLLISAGQAKAQQMKALAAWIKNNGLKKVNSKDVAAITTAINNQIADSFLESTAEASKAHFIGVTMATLALEEGKPLTKAVRIGAQAIHRIRMTGGAGGDKKQSKMADKISSQVRGRTLSPALTGKPQ